MDLEFEKFIMTELHYHLNTFADLKQVRMEYREAGPATRERFQVRFKHRDEWFVLEFTPVKDMGEDAPTSIVEEEDADIGCCSLCGCPAVCILNREGFRVCPYHMEHDEAEDPCPDCTAESSGFASLDTEDAVREVARRAGYSDSMLEGITEDPTVEFEEDTDVVEVEID